MAEPPIDVARLRLEPGDAVLVRTQENLTPAEAKGVADQVAKWLAWAGHPQVPVLFLDGGADLLVLNRQQQEAIGA